MRISLAVKLINYVFPTAFNCDPSRDSERKDELEEGLLLALSSGKERLAEKYLDQLYQGQAA